MTESMVSKLSDNFRFFKDALADDIVYDTFTDIVNKLKKTKNDNVRRSRPCYNHQ